MIKVMIVDDEYLIRLGLKSTIDWEKNGFEVVCDAYDGQEGLKLFKEFYPEIVITDIRMPNMNGLEMIKEIKKHSSKTKFIILSSHQEFSYAKQAIQLGADDYILKGTMEPGEILSVLMKVKKELNQMRGSRDVSETSNTELKIDDIKKFINGESVREDLIQFKYAVYSSIIGRIDDRYKNYIHLENQQKRLIKESILNIVKSKMDNNLDGYVIEWEDGVFLMLISVNATKLLSEHLIKEFLQSIERALDLYSNYSMSYIYSIPLIKLEELSRISRELIENQKRLIFKESKAFVSYSDIEKDKLNKSIKVDCQIDRVMHLLYQGDLEQVKKILEVVLLKETKKIENVTVLEYVIKQYINLLTHLGLNHLDLEESVKRHYDVKIPFMMDNIEQIEAWFIEEFRLILPSINRLLALKINDTVKGAIDYIRQNFQNNITLQDVGEYLSISPNYLSHMFKEEVGQNYSDYLNEVRMKRAEELLLFENLKFYEIANRCGFSDSGYFTKAFKKFTGLTPSQYRRQKYNR